MVDDFGGRECYLEKSWDPQKSARNSGTGYASLNVYQHHVSFFRDYDVFQIIINIMDF